ncbi:D-alanyl-D-alanine carboxypeptidase DacB precursor [Corynebacterium ciconiae DSM 44920]|uniref:serine hydrolase n=1 Tax=Corynebacterium ciconiae TaxID=227319 RepID=UPI0003806045|nr:serine hydrolase [Corynebacterium ciconiae]WKD61855.1 D-alanyl-D-alanine carboxypeptidase DacB precursor [Corynebacterium ciconiae DSM 44920]
MAHHFSRAYRRLPAYLLALSLSTTGMPMSWAQEQHTPSTTQTPPRTTSPDTDDCPHATTPPPPVDTSEEPAPGHSSPPPLPVADTNAGGAKLNDCGVITARGFTTPAGNTASSWIVFDLDSGEVFGAKDPHGRYRPASVIKALLALVSITTLDLDKKVEVSAESAGIEGSAVGIGPGGVYTNRQLISGLLMASGNDAAHALAQELGGDAIALEKVNALAQKLGARNTRAATYSGLDGPGMSTTAFDLALIYRQAWANPTFAEMVHTRSMDFPGWGEYEGFEVWNDNQLLSEHEDSLGGKTGYTDDANHTFVGAREVDGRRIAAVVLDATITPDKRAWQMADDLIDAAAATPESNPPLGTVAALDTDTQAASPSSPTDTDSTEAAAADEGESTASRGKDVALVLAFFLALITGGVVALAGWRSRRRGHVR